MEKESKTTRFCLICNYISRIIEPITSRCSKFRFKPLAKSILLQRLDFISTQEKIDVDKDVRDDDEIDQLTMYFMSYVYISSK